MKDVKEPAVKRDPSFSVILLRKDCSFGRFHVSSLMIKTLCVLAGLFVCASGAAGYGAHYYWKKYNDLRREKSELTAQINATSHQLSKFKGIGVIQDAQPSRGTNGTDSANGSQSRSGMVTIRTPAQPQTPPATTPATPTEQPAHAAQTPANPQDPAADPAHNTLQPAAGPTTPASATTPTEQPESGLTPNTAALLDVSVRPAGSQRVRIVFGLSNKNPQLTLDGRITLAVTDADGKSHEITDVKRAALRFLIKNYKKIDTTFGLPDSIRTAKVESVNVTVNAKNMEPATFSYPLR